MQEDSGGDDEGDLSELAATMDKLRVFDASVYFGKGSMLFTSTDQEKFWDEEISFDVHEARGVDIPPEATVLPPVEVMDALIEIYYQVTTCASCFPFFSLICHQIQLLLTWACLFATLIFSITMCIYR